MEILSRRRFIQTAAGAAALGPTFARASADEARAMPGTLASEHDTRDAPDAAFGGPLCFFSKHLPRMNGRELGRSLKALGFDGVDLTVRPGGHVDPKRVAIELPVFVDGIRNEGVAVPM